MEVIQCNQPATSGWLIPWGNGAVLTALCWSLLLVNWALSGGHSQVGLDKWKSSC